MANRRLIITFALAFSLVFSLFYYVLFTTVDFGGGQQQTRTLYLNQVGIYAESENDAVSGGRGWQTDRDDQRV